MTAPPDDLLTVAEASGYRRTALHREVVALLERLAARTDLLRLLPLGRSGLGQEIPVAVLSADGRFSPEAARASGRPTVLVVANIHAGEVEGKEAALTIARDATLGGLRRLVERSTVLLVPDYNPDGNDRIDASHRALDLARLEGQVGPEGGVGTRYTGEGWNLNRDCTKQDAVETRHLARLLAEWRPHVVVDCHTTDGSIHGYELTFDTSRNLAACPPGPALYARDVLLPRVAASLRARTGYRTWFYGNFLDGDDPSSGWASYPPLARYGSHFRGLLGSIDVLLEAYSYVDFATRCGVMREFLVEVLDAVGERGGEVVRLVEEAAADTVARGRDPRPDDLLGIAWGTPVRDASGALTFAHRGLPLLDHDVEAWDLESQRARRVPGRERRTYRATFHGRYEPTARVPRPFGYLVPATRASVLERLASHRLEHRVLAAGAEVEVEAYRVLGRETTASPDVGDAVRTETVLRVRPEARAARVRAGDVFVPTAQPWGNLAVCLLEPHSDDGLARWGHFDDLGPGDEFPVLRVPRPAVLPTD